MSTGFMEYQAIREQVAKSNIKYRIWSPRLLKLVSPSVTYVEVFGGAPALLFAKSPSKVEIYNDTGSGLVDLFRVLQVPEKFELMRDWINGTEMTLASYQEYADTWRDDPDIITRSAKWLSVARLSIADMAVALWRLDERLLGGLEWMETVGKLPQLHDRVMRVQIEHRDWRDILDLYDSEGTFFYIDPTLSGDKDPLSDQDHIDLVDLVQDLKGNVLLSCSAHPSYENLIGWDTEVQELQSGYDDADPVYDTLRMNYQLQPMLF